MNEKYKINDNLNEIRAYRERYIAFIDILGFSKHVEESIQDEELFKTLKTILSSAVITANRRRPNDVRSYQFSDSIVISTINDPEGLKEIINSVCFIYDNLISFHIFARGGITKGKLYDDARVVFGPGLIRAYHIEKNIAVYPRILMDSCIYKEVKEISYHKSHFRRDFDARHHLDIFKLGPFWEGNLEGVPVSYKKTMNIASTKEQWLSNIKQSIEEGLVKQKANKSVFKKYIWMAMYFNSFLKKSKDFHIPAIKLHHLNKLL